MAWGSDKRVTVEDPQARVGSGGATLNALLVVAERLSQMPNDSPLLISLLFPLLFLFFPSSLSSFVLLPSFFPLLLLLYNVQEMLGYNFDPEKLPGLVIHKVKLKVKVQIERSFNFKLLPH